MACINFEGMSRYKNPKTVGLVRATEDEILRKFGRAKEALAKVIDT